MPAMWGTAISRVEWGRRYKRVLFYICCKWKRRPHTTLVEKRVEPVHHGNSADHNGHLFLDFLI